MAVQIYCVTYSLKQDRGYTRTGRKIVLAKNIEDAIYVCKKDVQGVEHIWSCGHRGSVNLCSAEVLKDLELMVSTEVNPF